jgi:DNA-binding beta-propeller fold protein YncE
MSVLKKILRVVLAIVAAAAAGAAAIVAYLSYPGVPSHSQFMEFKGYIELPRNRTLDVLDYLTLHDGALFVTSERSGTVYKVALDSSHFPSSVVSQMPGGGATHHVLILPGGNPGFVTRSDENTIDAFDPQSLQVLSRIQVADEPDAMIYDGSHHLLYVANAGAKLGTLIDPDKRTIVATIALGGSPEFMAIDSKTGLLYQNLQDANLLVAINLDSRSVVERWPLAPCESPTGMAIDANQRRLYAVCAGNALLVVFDLDAHRVVTSLKIGGGPDSVALDLGLHRIYTTGKAGNVVIVEQEGPDNYRVLEEIRTHYGAHTLTVDPASHRVFVGYASLLVQPRIAVFSPVS